MTPEEAALIRLNEYDYNEWYDVARILKPDCTEAEYAAMWERYLRAKLEHLTSTQVH